MAARTAGEVNPPLVGTDEAAAALGVHPQTLRRMVNRGDVSVIRPGGRVFRFDLKSLVDALARGQRGAMTPMTHPAADVRA